jgi:tetratricopeptide (TPR) repeat protein
MAEHLGAVQIEAEALTTLAVLDGTPGDESITALEQAIELSKAHDITESESRAHNNLAVMLGIYRGEIDEARKHLQEAARIAHATGLIPIELFYRIGEFAWATLLGDLTYVDSELPLLQRLQDELGNPGTTEVFLGRAAAHAVHYRGDFQSAKELYLSNIEKSRDRGQLQDEYWTGIWYVDLLVDIDEFNKAEDVLLEIIDIGEKIGGGARPRFQMAILKAKMGDIQSAEQLLAQAEEQFAEQPAALWIPWKERARAFVALGNSEPAEAWDHFAKCIERAKGMHLNGVLGAYLLEWAQALIEHGEGEDFKKAEELVQEARAVFEALKAPKYIAMADARLKKIESAAS